MHRKAGRRLAEERYFFGGGVSGGGQEILRVGEEQENGGKGKKRVRKLLMAKFRCSNCSYQKRSLDQRMNKSFLPPAKKVSGRVVRASPPMPQLVLRKLFESNCGSVPLRCFYCLPPENYLQAYI